MATKLPYVSSPTLMTKILKKIGEAKTPDRFTYDFLETKLGFKGGNYKQFVSLAKKISLLNSDGSPTDLYKSFRNPASSKASMAAALKKGYHEVFERNEFAGSLDKEKFKGLVVEITGLEPKDRKVQLICQTFDVLSEFADFDAKFDGSESEGGADSSDGNDDNGNSGGGEGRSGDDLDLRLSYSINLVLPKTDDPAVFNAIFKSLRENLLKK